MIEASNLPDDIDALKAMLVARDAHIAAQATQLAGHEEALSRKDAALAEKEDVIAAKEGRIVQLEALVKAFRQAIFGRRSEKLDPDQYDLALEDIETAIAAVTAEDEATPPEAHLKERRARQPKGGRASLPKHLPRIEEVIEPESTVCACGQDLHAIGEDVSERLDVVPAQFRVIVTRRPRYACRVCEDGIRQAPAPARLIPGGLPTEATVAQVLVSKYADHVPLYRQSQIYARQGIRLDRSVLAGWVGRAAFELRPVYDCLLSHLKRSSKLFMDETPAPVLDPGRRKTKTGYLWALARDDRPWGGDDPPGVAFTYTPGRGGQYAEDILEGFEGILQVDGYAGYNRLIRRAQAPVTLAYCWAHARRKLHEVARNNSAPIAEEGLKRIAALYRIEADIRGESAGGRLKARQARAVPKIDAFRTWLDQSQSRVLGKSPLGEALRYIAKHWDGLTLYLEDGCIEMDNNTVERTIRPIALSRKNALFAGHDAGAQNWAMIASLIETCKLNAVDPQAWLTHIFEAIVSGHKAADIEALLPWNFKPL